MFNPSRDQARQFFFETWAKQKAAQTLTDLEKMALAIMLRHPEYHQHFDNPERYVDRDYSPEMGDINPFLHISMHLAIEEQLSIDQPVGIRGLYQQLAAKLGDEHDAEHGIMDCLGEMVWHAQRYRTSPDPAIYLGCVRGKLGIEHG